MIKATERDKLQGYGRPVCSAAGAPHWISDSHRQRRTRRSGALAARVASRCRGTLSEKGQVVFYGPPGTGKTYMAMALAKEITRNGGDSRVVQFHPSYSYEDFVGGFRPVEDDGAFGVKYQRTDGPLREIAALAAADPSHPRADHR